MFLCLENLIKNIIDDEQILKHNEMISKKKILDYFLNPIRD